MNKYESVILVSNKIKDEERKNTVNNIEKLISVNGINIELEELGEKTLAYEIRKHKKAFYYVINFEANSDFINELHRNYRIMENIIKFMTIKKED